MKKLLFLYLLIWYIPFASAQNLPCVQNGTCLQGNIVGTDGQGIEGIRVRLAGRPTTAISKGKNGVFELPSLNFPHTQSLFLIVEDPQGMYYLADSENDQIFEIKPRIRQKGEIIRIVMETVPKAKKNPKIALMPFCNFANPKTDIRPNAFMASTAHALEKIKDLETKSYTQSLAALQAMGLKSEDFCKQEKLIEVGKNLGVDLLVIGVYQIVDGRINIECQFVDINKQADFRGAIYLSRPEDELPQLLEELSLEILKRLQINPTEKEIAQIHAWHASKNSLSHTFLLNATRLTDEGKHTEAYTELEKLLAEQPDHELAKLKKVESLVLQNKNEAAANEAQKLELNPEILPENIQKILSTKEKIDTLQNLSTPTINIEFVGIEGGKFVMGSNNYEDEQPAHEVILASFSISKTEITNQQFAEFLQKYASDKVLNGEFKGELLIKEHEWGLRKEKNTWVVQKGYENHPVIEVTWYGANEFCKFYGGSLPSEAQWEYAAKGDSKTKNFKFSGSDTLNLVAWNNANSDSQTHAVAEKIANELGIFDMSGNVWEWCEDWYDKSFYANSVGATNPVNTTKNAKRASKILRGGSWYSLPNGCQLSYRNSDSPDSSNDVIGFRMVK